MRWQEREAAAGVAGDRGARSRSLGARHCAPDANGGLRLGTYRDLWAGEVTERNPALRFLAPAQRVELAVADGERLGLTDGDEVEVRSNGSSVRARVALRERMRPGAAFLIEGTAAENANRLNGAEVVEIVTATPAPRRRAEEVAGLMLLADTTFAEATWIMIVKSIIIFLVVFMIVPVLTVVERKLIGRFQHRYGPNRVGPVGLLQPVADILKLVGKQVFRPDAAVPFLYAIGPALVIFSGITTIAILPFGDVQDGVGLYGIDVPIGVLYFFAFGSISFYGLLLSGWASGSKYSFLGAMRSAAQLISYEVAMGLSLLGAIMMAGSLSLVSIVEAQGQVWYIVPQFIGFLVFMVAGFAETNRAPFDLPEADAELVQGFQTEYGGTRFGAFLLAEYLEIFVVSGIAAAFFLGGWMGPGPSWLDPIWMIAKIMALILVFIWIRATLPRLRYDQLMSLGWKVLLPLATLNVLVDGGAGGGDMNDERAVPVPQERRRGDLRPARPKAGGARGAYRAFGETLRGLKTTLARVIEGPMTIQYPEEKTPVYPRFRGRHKLHVFEDSGLEKCVGCSLCAAACPADCIRVVAAENDPDDRVSAGERYAAVYEINMARCIFCGYCEVACPFDAITMGHEYELADYNRGDLIFTKEMLLAEPIERTPLRRSDERTSEPSRPRRPDGSGRLLRRCDRRARGRDRRDRAAQPLLQRAGADRAPDLAGRALPAPHAEFIAAAQIVVYAGAVMVLYLFVAAYVGAVEEPIWEPIPGQRLIGAAARRGAVRRGLDRGGRHLAGLDRHGGADDQGGVRLPGRDRQAAARALPGRLRGRLDAPSDRRRRRDRARGAQRAKREPLDDGGTPQAKPGRSPPDGRFLVPRPLSAAIRGGRLRGAAAPQPAGDPALPRTDAERRQPRAGRLLALVGQRGGSGVRADRDGRRRVRGRRRARVDRGHVQAQGAPGRR